MSETLENHKHDLIHSGSSRGDLDFCWDCTFTQPCAKKFPDCQYCVALPMRPRSLLVHDLSITGLDKEQG